MLIFNADAVLLRQRKWQLSKHALGNCEVLGDMVHVNADGYVSLYVGNESNVDVLFSN